LSERVREAKGNHKCDNVLETWVSASGLTQRRARGKKVKHAACVNMFREGLRRAKGRRAKRGKGKRQKRGKVKRQVKQR